MKTFLFEGFKHIGVSIDVCGSRPIVIGTRLEPHFIVNYGSVEDVLEDYDYLTLEQVEECYWFLSYLNL
jgi:uncharacterized protein (DUF433 family)